MVRFLSTEIDEANVITDANMLLRPAGPQLLDARPGWSRDTSVEDGDGDVELAYELGEPGLYLHGENAVFHLDGTISLSAFANNANGTSFVQMIKVADDGEVLGNDVYVLPR